MRLFFLISCLISLLIGCSKKEAKYCNKEQILRICLNLDVRSLDPRSSHDDPSNHVVKMLFEGLFRIGLDGKVRPAIAESFHISADKRQYIFHLRSSKWSNGREVTAYDFEYAWKQVVDPKLSNNGAHMFYPIKNVQALIQGNATIDEVGIKALNAKTLQVDLEHPAPFFLETLTLSSFCPVSKEDDLKNPQWAIKEGGEFICNGPFCLKSWQKGYELIVEKNSNYWDAKSVRLNQIKIGIVNNLSTQLSLFEKKEIDWIGKPLAKLPLDAIPTLREVSNLNYFSSLGVYWYFFNVQKFPFNNTKMRKAFAYSINRKEITDHLLQENERPATSILPTFLSSKTEHFTDGDIDLARKLFQEGLDEMGISQDELGEIVLSYGSSELNNKVAQIIQNQWKNALGIVVRLQHQEWKSYYNQLLEGDYQIGGMSWYSWVKDPSYNLETFKYTSDGINMSRWENIRYQELLNCAQVEIDEENRMKFFHEAEELLLDEMPVIPVYFLNITFANNENLTNFYISELNEIDFKWAYFR